MRRGAGELQVSVLKIQRAEQASRGRCKRGASIIQAQEQELVANVLLNLCWNPHTKLHSTLVKQQQHQQQQQLGHLQGERNSLSDVVTDSGLRCRRFYLINGSLMWQRVATLISTENWPEKCLRKGLKKGMGVEGGNVDRGGHARQKGGCHKFQLDKTQSRQRCLYNAFTSHWPIKYALKLRLIPIDKAQLHRSQHVLGWAQSEQCHLRFLCKFNLNFAAEKYLWKRLFVPHVANVQLKRVCLSKVLPRSACLLFVRLFV